MKNFTLLLFFIGIAQLGLSQEVLKGQVNDQGTNEPLIGANILIQGESTGAITDSNGQFELGIPASGYPFQIIVSYTGYEPQNLTVADNTNLEITLSEGISLGDMVVVSASRRREKIEKAPSSVNIITSKAISQVVTQNPLELIGREKGVDFVQKGVNEVDVNIRGFNTAFNTSTLYLTDGKLNTFIAANLPYGLIDPVVKEDISRIEVVLGPSSSLYGANAFSGLVNIATKNPFSEAGTDIALTAGNQGVLSGRLSSRHQIGDKFGIKVTGEYTDWTDFDYTDPLITPIGEVPEVGLPTDHNVYKGNGNLYYKLGDGELSGGLSYSKGDYIAPTSVGRNYYNDIEVFQKQIKYTSPRFFAQVYHTSEKNDNSYTLSLASFYQYLGQLHTIAPDNPAFAPFAPFSQFNDEQLAAAAAFKIDHSRLGVEAQYNNSISENLNYIVGIQGLFDETNTSQTSNWDFDGPISQEILSAYAHAEWKMNNKFRTVAALRLDNHNSLGTSFTPKLAFLYDVNDNSAFRLTYGRGFKFPTIQQANAFILNGGFFNGHNKGFTLADGTEIPPVNSTIVNSFEFGYKNLSADGKVFVDASVFYEINKEFITTTPITADNPATQYDGRPFSELSNLGTAANGTFSAYTNFGRVDGFGLDFKINYKFNDKLSLNGFYSFFSFDKKLNDREIARFDQNANGINDEHEVPLNTPKHKMGAGLNYKHNKFYGNIFAKWVAQYNFYNSFIIASESKDYLYRVGPGATNIQENSAVFTHPTLGSYFNRGPLGGYVNVSLSAGYNISDNISISGSVMNLFDAEVRDLAGAPTIGRLIKGEIQFHF